MDEFEKLFKDAKEKAESDSPADRREKMVREIQEARQVVEEALGATGGGVLREVLTLWLLFPSIFDGLSKSFTPPPLPPLPSFAIPSPRYPFPLPSPVPGLVCEHFRDPGELNKLDEPGAEAPIVYIGKCGVTGREKLLSLPCTGDYQHCPHYLAQHVRYRAAALAAFPKPPAE